MKRKRTIIIVLVLLPIMAWLAFGFFGIQALFFDRVVDEALPPAVQAMKAQDSHEGIVSRGTFQQGDSTYTITGSAYLSTDGGKTTLSFTDFKVSNGPDLFVYAVQVDATENKTVKTAVADGKFKNIGQLKGNIGNQNYLLDSDFTSADYPVIAIWCRRFSRNFGSALLQ